MLGVRPGSAEAEVAAAYREQAKRWHPDRAGADGEDRMAEINVAYDVLRAGAQHSVPPARSAGPAWAAGWRTRSAARSARSCSRRSTRARRSGSSRRSSTWASPRAILALTERRFLWLLDDAPVARVRSIPLRDVAGIEHRDAPQAGDADRAHAGGAPSRVP